MELHPLIRSFKRVVSQVLALTHDEIERFAIVSRWLHTGTQKFEAGMDCARFLVLQKGLPGWKWIEQMQFKTRWLHTPRNRLDAKMLKKEEQGMKFLKNWSREKWCYWLLDLLRWQQRIVIKQMGCEMKNEKAVQFGDSLGKLVQTEVLHFGLAD